ncbi:hypothetical protein [Bradyrhizobium cenepequi]|uniref:hypothetical protein n=1 Tax=Bradyrhizobium cenepequi TaxID=2821403 RepID=UPI001CE29121|nr:hypothetical protein [Bradyrhizobium cenepequi]MCA6112243.1 hypothetical protein [Bradyrhizobium cenepequi]
MTEPTSQTDTRQRRSPLPWLAVVLAAAIVAGGAFWMNHDAGRKSAAEQQKADMLPAIEQIKQTISSLQRTVQDIQSDQQKLAGQVTYLQQKASAQQGERKLLSDQLGALSARVDTLVSSNAESTPAAPQKNRRGKR